MCGHGREQAMPAHLSPCCSCHPVSALLRQPSSSAGAAPSAGARWSASGSLRPGMREEPGVQLGVGVRRRPRIVARLGIDREPDVAPTLP
jgi:hypothetical protein